MYRTILSLVIFSGLLVSTGKISAQEFPPLNVTIYDSSATQGYYFIAPYKAYPPYTYLHPQLILDHYGRIVYYRIFPGFQIGTTNSADFKILPDGRLSYYTWQDNIFFILDSTFTIIDTMDVVNGYTIDMHDFQLLDNGHYLMLANESRYMNLSAYHWFGINHNQPGSTNAEVLGVVIQEIDENKNLVWEWKGHDHFQFDDVDQIWLQNPNKVDWTHSNAVELDSDGNILLSSRHFNEITKIDYQSGNIIWRLGGKENQFTFTNDPMQFDGQHDIRRLPNGNITLFDNGRYHTPAIARALEYALDETSMTATLVWEYIQDSSLYSIAMGSFQTLDYGNRLIDFGSISGSGFSWFSVVKEDKSKVMEIYSPNGYTSYRAYNYLTLPWDLGRPDVDCIESGGQFYLEAEEGHPSYLWSNGATTRSIPVDDTGTYSVTVPKSFGYIASEFIQVANILNPCLYLDIQENITGKELTLDCIPNPLSSGGRVEFNLPAASSVQLTLVDLQGKTHLMLSLGNFTSGIHTVPLDGSSLSKGMYLLRLTTNNSVAVKKILVF